SFWFLRYHRAEMRPWLDQLLTLPAEPAARAAGPLARAQLADQGSREDMALAGRVAAERLAIYEELGNRFGIADANWMRVRSPVWALTPGDGMPFAEELLAQARGLGDHRWGRALLMVSNGFRRVGRLD